MVIATTTKLTVGEVVNPTGSYFININKSGNYDTEVGERHQVAFRVVREASQQEWAQAICEVTGREATAFELAETNSTRRQQVMVSIATLNPNRSTLATAYVQEADLERKHSRPVATLQRMMFRLDRSDVRRINPYTGPAILTLMQLSRQIKRGK